MSSYKLPNAQLLGENINSEEVERVKAALANIEHEQQQHQSRLEQVRAAL